MHNKPHTEEARAKMSKSHTGVPLHHMRRPSKLIDGIEHYRCSRCEKFLPKWAFYKNKRTILGITSECKACHCKTAYRSRDREKANVSKRVSEATRRARKANTPGTVKKSDYEQLIAILGKKCLRCGGSENIQWGHVVPLAKGGEHSILNLQPLCRKCNERKQVKKADYRTREQVWVIEFERRE